MQLIYEHLTVLIRSPLIGSVSHQGGVGHYTVRRGRTGGQFAGLSPREERGAAPSHTSKHLILILELFL